MRRQEVEQLLVLSVDPSRRKEAEELTQRIDGSAEEVRALLAEIGKATEPLQSMGGIFLKRSLARMGDQEDREGVRASVVVQSSTVGLACSYRAHLLLCEAVAIAGKQLSSEVMKCITQQLDPSEAEYSEQTVRLLNLIGAYVEKYRVEAASEKLYLDIIAMLEQMGEKLLQLCSGMRVKKHPKEMYCAVFEILVSLITQDLPDFIENNLGEFVESAMECVNLRSEREVLLMITVLEMLSTRFIDAFDDGSVFLNHAIEVFAQIETMDENVQCMFLQYFTSLLRNPMLEHFLSVHREYVINLLMARASHFEDIDEPIEFTRSMFNTDMNLQRYVACDMVRDLIEKDPATFSQLAARETNPASLFYLTAYLMRGRDCVAADAVARVLEKAKLAIAQYRPLDPKCVEQNERQVFCAAGVLVTGLLSGKYKVVTEEGYLFKSLAILGSLKEPNYLFYMMAKLVELIAASFPDQSIPIEKNAVMFLLAHTLRGPPNEFLAPALFEVVRLSRSELFPILEACARKLLSTIETSGSLGEAKGLWDVLSLGAIGADEECRRMVFETAKECLLRDAADWFLFALQLISLCALFSAVPLYGEYLELLVANQELWAAKELVESLSFCVLSLYYNNPARYAGTVESIFGFLSAQQDKSSFLFTRYLPDKQIRALLASTNKTTPDMYLGCFRACVGQASYQPVVDKHLQSFLNHPIVHEQDTRFFISLLSSEKLYASPFAQQHRVPLQAVLKRLSQRVIPKKEEYKKLVVIDRVFFKIRAGAQ